jgi:hypothetical protein
MIDRKIIVYIGSAACLLGCTGDFLSLFMLGKEYPGYNQLFDTMSSLGSSASPVSDIISMFWIILGILMITFAFGFRAAYASDRYVKIVFWLLIFYGLGEGLGSGFFKADRVSGSFTTSYILHDILGGAGVFAILILPLIVRKIKPYFSGPGFIRFSYITFILSTVFLILFSFRFLDNGENIVAKYKGLWQRLFVMVFYIYMITIAIKMASKTIRQDN